MNRYLVCALVVALTAWVTTAAVADIITIDGDDAEWSDPDFENTDPNESMADSWDIAYTAFIWDESAQRLNFLVRTYDPWDNTYSADYLELLIDADDESTTGTNNWHEMTGADYRVWWSLDGSYDVAYDADAGSDAPLMQDYDAGATPEPFTDSSPAPSGDELEIAWGNHDGTTGYTAIEIALDPTYIDWPSQFVWGAYVDNGGNPSDDTSPDNMDQRGYTPEPTTLALVPLGLAALAAWRRRRGDE